MFVSVILSTYDSPEWLAKVIWGYAAQTHHGFELVIADDGSSSRTRETIDALRRAAGLDIRHVWQPRRGFRKCSALNEAIRRSSADYLVFSDGDCIPRRDFLAQHVRLAAAGRFLSGGVVRLPLALSRAISIDDILAGRATAASWLVRNGLRPTRKLRLLAGAGRLAAVADALLTTRATFNGHNASAWKADLLAVNGFDERMGYGGLDRELGERLVNHGVRGRQIRHRAVCVHLDHRRDYVDERVVARNQRIRRRTREARLARTAHGIWQPPRPEFIAHDQQTMPCGPVFEPVAAPSAASMAA